MSGVSVKVTDRSHEVLADIGKLSHANMRELAETMVEMGIENAPYRTGHLQGSISRDERGDCHFEVFSETGGGEYGEGYGAYVELGTSKMAAQPFLAPALEQGMNEMKQAGRWR